MKLNEKAVKALGLETEVFLPLELYAGVLRASRAGRGGASYYRSIDTATRNGGRWYGSKFDSVIRGHIVWETVDE